MFLARQHVLSHSLQTCESTLLARQLTLGEELEVIHSLHGRTGRTRSYKETRTKAYIV